MAAPTSKSVDVDKLADALASGELSPPGTSTILPYEARKMAIAMVDAIDRESAPVGNPW
jgi:hypothetical protein